MSQDLLEREEAVEVAPEEMGDERLATESQLAIRSGNPRKELRKGACHLCGVQHVRFQESSFQRYTDDFSFTSRDGLASEADDGSVREPSDEARISAFGVQPANDGETLGGALGPSCPNVTEHDLPPGARGV